MVTFLNFNFLLFFILFFHYLIFFIQIHVSFFSFCFFFFPLCFSPPHTYSSYLIHPQPHLLTFNHFLFFIVLSYCYFFSSSSSPFFNCALFISLSKTQALVPLSPLFFFQLSSYFSLFLWFMVFFFFLVQRKKLQKKPFWAWVLPMFASFFFFFLGSGGFDECGCGWVCD